MEESAIKGHKVLDLNDSVADAPKPRIFTTVSVEGYDTSLPEYYVELALEKHFASCGEILLCYVPRDYARGILKSVSFVRFEGGAAEEKALKLNGTDLGRSTAIVKPATLPSLLLDVNPFPVDISNPSTWIKHYTVRVTGYDTSLPEIDLKMALCRHFSSCGDVWTIDVLSVSNSAYIHLRGEGSLEKALELNGSNMGNMTLVVKPLLSRPRDPRTYSVGEPQSVLLDRKRKKMEKRKKKETKIKMEKKKQKEKK